MQLAESGVVGCISSLGRDDGLMVSARFSGYDFQVLSLAKPLKNTVSSCHLLFCEDVRFGLGFSHCLLCLNIHAKRKESKKNFFCGVD